MLGPRSFGVTDRNPHGKTAFAGVVSIAKEHLEMAPESLLAIAANQYPDGEVIPLTSWPEPSLITFQVTLPGVCHLYRFLCFAQH